MSDPARASEDWHQAVPKGILRPALIGLALLFAAFAGFGVWAGTAPISGAVVASGSFIATGQNKIVQHLEGGIVREILVKEGDAVAPGDVLVRLDDTAALAQLRRLVLKRTRLLAMHARLDAERRSLAEIAFPETLEREAGDPEVRAIIDGQRIAFAARRDELASETAVLKQRIAAVREEIGGLEAQRTASVAQLDLINREIVGQERLYGKGLAKLTALLALKRAKAKLEGARGEFSARIGRAKERITETRSQIIHLRSKRIETAVEELRQVEAERDDVEERLKAARDVLTRIEIRAPVKGIVVKLLHHTPGGVVSAGQEILELLPVEDELLVEALVRPMDIDLVQAGSTAQLRLTALNQRITPMVPGRVSYVSADTIEGKQQGETFYVSRIRIDEAEARKVEGFKAAPGMPVEVYIETGARTFLQYLMQPISDSFSRAFRET